MTFFSFQDIITCTAGIMVLLTLLLLVELLMRPEVRPPTPPTPPVDLKQRVEEARRQRDGLKNLVDEGRGVLAQLSTGATITQTQIEALRLSIEELKKLLPLLRDRIEDLKGGLRLAIGKVAKAEQDVARVGQEIQDIKTDLQQMAKRPPITLLGGQRGGKEALFAECSAGECLVAQIPQEGAQKGLAQEVRRFTGADAYGALLAWARGERDPAREYFVLLIRPDAVDQWEPSVLGLKGTGFDVGWDVWPPGKSLLGRP